MLDALLAKEVSHTGCLLPQPCHPSPESPPGGAGGKGRAGQGQETGSSPEVVEVWLLTAEVVSLPLRALASGKLTPASRRGQKGSMANLQEVGTGSEGSPPRTSGGRALRWEGQLVEDREDWGRDNGGHASERCCVGLSQGGGLWTSPGTVYSCTWEIISPWDEPG